MEDGISNPTVDGSSPSGCNANHSVKSGDSADSVAQSTHHQNARQDTETLPNSGVGAGVEIWHRVTDLPPLGGCVYRLILSGRCVYVGQTTNLLSRLAAHQVAGFKFDAVTYQACEPRSVRLKRERKMIERERPPLNRRYTDQLACSREQVIALANVHPPVVDHIGAALASSLRRPRGAGKGKA
jgi:hypothetical protein